MDKVIFSDDRIPSIKDIEDLYNDAGWVNYIKDLENLQNAYKNSLKIISAWDGEKLVGIIRVVGDGYTIIYIQDIIVLNEYHRQGIGSKLINEILEEYAHVRQKVLMSDNKKSTVAFYNKLGFVKTEKYNGIAFVKYNFQ